MLGNIDALPRAERKRSGNHRHEQRHPGEHRLYERRHDNGPDDIVTPGVPVATPTYRVDRRTVVILERR